MDLWASGMQESDITAAKKGNGHQKMGDRVYWFHTAVAVKAVQQNCYQVYQYILAAFKR